MGGVDAVSGCLSFRAYIPARESTGGINRRGSCTVDPVLG